MIDVYLNDSKINYDDALEYFKTAADWAKKYCPSFQGYDVQDVSDFTYYYDYLAVYLFKDQKDADWFILRWK